MEATLKKPRPDFVVRLVAPGLRPWAVPVRSLSRVLDAVQRLIEQRDDTDEDSVIDEAERDPPCDERVLKLLDVKESSAIYTVSAPNPKLAIDILQDTGRAIESPRAATWTSATLSSLKELSDTAKALGCVIEFRQPGKGKNLGDVIATIQPSTYSSISAYAFISGYTSVFGKIERVGGATEMHCGLRLPDHPRKMVICRVMGEALVRELGQYMYQYVMVSGLATWLRHDRRLKRLEISSFEKPKTGSIRKALHDIHAAGGHMWDQVEDTDALITEMRGT